MEENNKPISDKLKNFLNDNITVLPFLKDKLNNITEQELSDLFLLTTSTCKHYFHFGRWSDKYSARCGFDHDIWETKGYNTYSEGLEESIIEFVNSFNYIDETGNFPYIIDIN